jgi:DNA-nicking Smr family endonuclease
VLGEKTRAPERRDLAPTLPELLGQAPLQMDAKTHGKMTRGKLAPEARIDLHGLTLAEAHPELIRFILNAQSQGMRLVLVITGKGKRREDVGPIPQRMGALRHQVPHWLRLPPLGPAVLQVSEAHLKHGGSGAYYVYLRRRG